jgi:Recombination endonuclease VII
MPKGPCSEPDCDLLATIAGFCGKHYHRARQRDQGVPLGICRNCGGPKPIIRGRRYCDDCQHLTCIVEGCQELARSRTNPLCHRHDMQRLRELRPKPTKKCRDCESDLPDARQVLCDQCREDAKKRSVDRRRQWTHRNRERLRQLSRESYIRNKYGLTTGEYDAIVAAGCAICGARPADRQMHCDHDHQTGAVRDALCSHCNAALGLFGDDPIILRRAAQYVLKHQRGPVVQLRLA